MSTELVLIPTQTYSLTALAIRSTKCVSVGQNQGVSNTMLPPEALQGSPFLSPCLLKLLELHSLARGSLLHL